MIRETVTDVESLLHDWHMDAVNMLSGMLGACNIIGFESSTKEAGNDA